MNVLFVGAHHDDLEISIGGTVKRWSQEGHRVYGAVLSNSTWTTPHGKTMRDVELAKQHARHAARILGYEPIHLNYGNCFEIQYSDDKVSRLINLIEEYSIDTLITFSPNDFHPDHRTVSQIAVSAAKQLPRVLFTRVSWSTYINGFKPNFFVDITGFLDIKLHALRCYTDEYERTGALWERYVRATADLYGLEIGCRHAEGFEVLKYCYDLRPRESEECHEGP